MNPCKRMTVTAIGISLDRFAVATNGNLFQCTNEPGRCGCIHAEINLLAKLPSPEILYISHSPCLACAKAISLVPSIKLVVYKEPYRLTEGLDYLAQNGIKVVQLK